MNPLRTHNYNQKVGDSNNKPPISSGTIGDGQVDSVSLRISKALQPVWEFYEARCEDALLLIDRVTNIQSSLYSIAKHAKIFVGNKLFSTISLVGPQLFSIVFAPMVLVSSVRNGVKFTAKCVDKKFDRACEVAVNIMGDISSGLDITATFAGSLKVIGAVAGSAVAWIPAVTIGYLAFATPVAIKNIVDAIKGEIFYQNMLDYQNMPDYSSENKVVKLGKMVKFLEKQEKHTVKKWFGQKRGDLAQKLQVALKKIEKIEKENNLTQAIKDSKNLFNALKNRISATQFSQILSALITGVIIVAAALLLFPVGIAMLTPVGYGLMVIASVLVIAKIVLDIRANKQFEAALKLNKEN